MPPDRENPGAWKPAPPGAWKRKPPERGNDGAPPNVGTVNGSGRRAGPRRQRPRTWEPPTAPVGRLDRGGSAPERGNRQRLRSGDWTEAAAPPNVETVNGSGASPVHGRAPIRQLSAGAPPRDTVPKQSTNRPPMPILVRMHADGSLRQCPPRHVRLAAGQHSTESRPIALRPSPSIRAEC